MIDNFFVSVIPTCSSQQSYTQGVTKDKSVFISCLVDANPPEVNFTWKLNGSLVGQSVPLGEIKSSGTKSVINYTATVDHDYGTLLCSATNIIGEQKIPCVTQLIPAGKLHTVC